MGYADQGDLSIDPDFRARIAACVAKEPGMSVPGEHPTSTADKIQWQVSAAPGFGDKYASALAGNVPRPGRDPSVISDEEILAAVTQVLAPAEGGGS